MSLSPHSLSRTPLHLVDSKGHKQRILLADRSFAEGADGAARTGEGDEEIIAAILQRTRAKP